MGLPAEIYNLIFDECIPDKALIAAWGLVSKDHLISTRFHLFSTVRLDHTNAFEFSDIMETPSCEIPPLVQHLVRISRCGLAIRAVVAPLETSLRALPSAHDPFLDDVIT